MTRSALQPIQPSESLLRLEQPLTQTDLLRLLKATLEEQSRSREILPHLCATFLISKQLYHHNSK